MIRINIGIRTKSHFLRSATPTKRKLPIPIKQPQRLTQAHQQRQPLQILRRDYSLHSTLGADLDKAIDQLEAYSKVKAISHF